MQNKKGAWDGMKDQKSYFSIFSALFFFFPLQIVSECMYIIFFFIQ